LYARVPLTCFANVSASISGCSFGCCGAAVTVVAVGDGPKVTAEDANGDTSYDHKKKKKKKNNNNNNSESHSLSPTAHKARAHLLRWFDDYVLDSVWVCVVSMIRNTVETNPCASHQVERLMDTYRCVL
jgi:hypothetical protein